MNKPHVYLDLDRTLFKTDDFTGQIWRLIGKWHDGVEADEELKRYREFYHESGGMEYYNFTEHLKKLGLPVDDTYQRLRGSDLADGRFEYAGTKELVDWVGKAAMLGILTYGLEDYQNLKVALCPSLEGVKVVTVLSQKQHFLREHCPEGSRAWMVDDKPIGDQLPKNIQFIQAVKYNGIESDDQHDWSTADSLQAVQEQIALKIDS